MSTGAPAISAIPGPGAPTPWPDSHRTRVVCAPVGSSATGSDALPPSARPVAITMLASSTSTRQPAVPSGALPVHVKAIAVPSYAVLASGVCALTRLTAALAGPWEGPRAAATVAAYVTPLVSGGVGLNEAVSASVTAVERSASCGALSTIWAPLGYGGPGSVSHASATVPSARSSALRIAGGASRTSVGRADGPVAAPCIHASATVHAVAPSSGCASGSVTDVPVPGVVLTGAPSASNVAAGTHVPGAGPWKATAICGLLGFGS